MHANYERKSLTVLIVSFNSPILNSDGYIYPWIQIDFGWMRFIDGVNLSLSQAYLQDLDDDLEVRFGFEMPR